MEEELAGVDILSKLWIRIAKCLEEGQVITIKQWEEEVRTLDLEQGQLKLLRIEATINTIMR